MPGWFYEKDVVSCLTCSLHLKELHHVSGVMLARPPEDSPTISSPYYHTFHRWCQLQGVQCTLAGHGPLHMLTCSLQMNHMEVLYILIHYIIMLCTTSTVKAYTSAGINVARLASMRPHSPDVQAHKPRPRSP